MLSGKPGIGWEIPLEPLKRPNDRIKCPGKENRRTQRECADDRSCAAQSCCRQAVMHGIRRPQPTAPPQNSRLVLPEMRLSAPAAAPGVPESAVRTKAKSTKASPPCTAQPAACSQRGDSASSFPAAARISINPTAQASPEKIQSTGIAAVVQSGTPTA